MSSKSDGKEGTVNVTFLGNIAVVEMKCGENRMNPSFFSKVHTALDEVERNQECMALITVGSGKFYSNGIDLEWAAATMQLEEKLRREFTISFNKFIARILTFPLPTIAAVNGHAYAGGAILALAHDYMVMRSDRGYWCLNEISIGLPMPMFPMNVIKAKLPSPLLVTQAMLHGRRFSSREAQAAGFCSGSCDGAHLLENAVRLIRETCGEKGFSRAILSQMKNGCYKSALDCIYQTDVNVDFEKAKL